MTGGEAFAYVELIEYGSGTPLLACWAPSWPPGAQRSQRRRLRPAARPLALATSLPSLAPILGCACKRPHSGCDACCMLSTLATGPRANTRGRPTRASSCAERQRAAPRSAQRPRRAVKDRRRALARRPRPASGCAACKAVVPALPRPGGECACWRGAKGLHGQAASYQAGRRASKAGVVTIQRGATSTSIAALPPPGSPSPGLLPALRCSVAMARPRPRCPLRGGASGSRGRGACAPAAAEPRAPGHPARAPRGGGGAAPHLPRASRRVRWRSGGPPGSSQSR
jgi:hypothetical protein